MHLFLLILAAPGFAAVCRRLLRSVFRAARQGAYVLYAREIAATRARRGDLTGMEEAREWVGHARRERLQALGAVGLWFALLSWPLMVLRWSLPVYAVYSVAWLIPKAFPRGRKPSVPEATTSGGKA